MISKGFLVFLVALCTATAFRVRREESAVDMFKEDIVKVSEKVKEAGEHISKMLGLDNNPVSDNIVQIIKNQTATFADQAEQVQKQLELELKKVTGSPVADTFAELSKKLSETVMSFRRNLETSEIGEKASELQGKFQEGINTLLEESKKVAQSLEPQVTEAGKELEKLAGKVLDDAVQNLDQLEKRLHAATGHAKSQ